MREPHWANHAFKTLRFLAVAALAAGATGACAQSLDGDSWRCDTDYGTYSRNPIPIPKSATTVSGRISFNKPHSGPEWASIAKIGFTDSDLGSDCHCDGLYMEAAGEPLGAIYSMLVDGHQVPLDSKRKLGVPITFKISIDPNGGMTVAIGKEHLVTQSAVVPPGEHDTLLMSCSGADVTFMDLKVE